MKVKVLNATLEAYWYSNSIGEEFDVIYLIKDRDNTYRQTDKPRYIRNVDVVITELPESFCVKRCDNKENWKKYIVWLNKTYDTTNLGKFVEYLGYYTSHNVVGSDKPLGTEIHIDDMIKHIDYMERHIKGGEQFHKESQLTVKMNTQKLSRQGLKEIHSIACSTWKITLEGWGSRNPLEDYIELTQEEVNQMFDACTKDQLPIVSKYLKKDDLLDFNKVSGSIQTPCGQQFIGKRVFGKFENKSFYLHNAYDWEIKEDDLGELCLIPTKKK